MEFMTKYFSRAIRNHFQYLNLICSFYIYTQQVKMDFEFIQLEHRENILKLMEICGIEMKQAYDLYTQSGYNFQAAVSRKFNEINNPPPHNAFQQPVIPQQANYYPQAEYFQNQYLEDDGDYKYAQYKQFIKNGRSFTSKYPVRKHQSFFQRIIPSFFKKQAIDPFKEKLQRYIERRINLKNTVGNLSQVLEWSWKQKFPALIMILNFSPDSKDAIKKMFSQDAFVQQVLNQQFKLYGITATQYNLQQQLKTLFNLQRDVNSFVVCRVNHLQEIEVMHRIKVSQPYEEIKKKLKLVKSQCIQLEMEESNIVKQYLQERKGNFSYKRPRTIKENLKLKEDKKIRKQQQQEFYKAYAPKDQGQKPKVQQVSSNKQEKIQKKQEAIHESVNNKREEISQQALQKLRSEKFAKITKYTNGLTFKIRVPSGQNIIINVDGQQLVQYLFDYISNEPNDLGFADDNSRNFDIFMGFGGSQTLRGKQNEQLKSLFEDSEVLIVREISE